MSKNFANFTTPHCHIQSLDSASTPEAFVKRELDLGTGTLTVTDHGSLAAVRQVVGLAKKNGLIAIPGIESYFRDDNCPILTDAGILKDDKGTFTDYWKYGHITLHAQDQEGYETLSKVISRADARAEKHGSERKPLFGWADLEEIGSKNVTVGSSCLIGFCQRHLMAHQRGDIAIKYFDRVKSIFKPGNFFVEVFPHKCDSNWSSGVLITYSVDGKPLEERVPKYKNLKTNHGIVKAEDLAMSWARGNSPHETVYEIMQDRKWVAREGRLIRSVTAYEGFVKNECSPTSPNGDLQRGCNGFVLELAKSRAIPVLCSDDSHYATPNEYQVQNIRLLSGGGSWRFNPGYHRQSSAEAFEHFRETLGTTEAEFEGWVENSRAWADGFKDFEFKDEVSLPTSFYPADTMRHVKELIDKHGRMRWNDEKYTARLKEELGILKFNGKIDLLSYFFMAEENTAAYEAQGKLTGTGRGCLTGNAKVLTDNGYKRLDTVAVGDRVYTHTGAVRTVSGTMAYDISEKLVQFTTTSKYEPFALTKDHKVFAYHRERVITQNQPSWKKGKVRVFEEAEPTPSWIEADRLVPGDMIFTPHINYLMKTPSPIDLSKFTSTYTSVTEDKLLFRTRPKLNGCRSLGPRSFLQKVRNGYLPLMRTKNGRVATRGAKAMKNLVSGLEKLGLTMDAWRTQYIDKEIDRWAVMDSDLAYFLGRWVGDGWVKDGKRGSYVGIAFNSNDTAGIARLSSIGKRWALSISHRKHKTKQLVQVIFYGAALAGLMRQLFPDYENTSRTKYLGDLKDLPPELLKSALEGLLDSDGHEETQSGGTVRTCLDTTSPRLCEEFRESLLRLGIPSAVGQRKEFKSGGYLCRPSFKIRFKWTNSSDGGTWCVITKKEEIDYVGKVYDIEVPFDHSYLTSEFAVHNSAAGLLLSYLLGITHADPLEWDLSLERFITLDRIKSGKLPDIDQDLPDREIALEWLEQRFPGHYAQLSVDTTLRLRSSIKDVARVTHNGQVPYEIEELTKKMVNAPQGVEDARHVFGYTNEEGDEVKGSVTYDAALMTYVARYPKEWEVVKKALGLVKNKGRHASAYCVTGRPIGDFIPLTSVSGVTVTQPTAKYVEESGGVKMDYLTVNSLNDIAGAIKLIQQRNGIDGTQARQLNGEKVPGMRIVPLNGQEYDIWKLPEDVAVFEDINGGRTQTVFQLDTPSARQWMKEFHVASKLDIAAFTALDRPGPLDVELTAPDGSTRNALQEYAKRAAGAPRAPTPPILDEILPDTYGLLVYQEGLQKVYQTLTGCTAAEAEQFRSDISKKQKTKVEKAYPFFMERAAAKVGAEQAQEVWDMLATWSSYGFNKSHAVCYGAITAYACAFLKHHYPLEWWTSVLRNADKNEINSKFWSYCGHLIDLPDVAHCASEFEIVGDRIRAPVSLLTGIGDKAHAELTEGAPYKDIDDLCQKIEARKVAKGQTITKDKRVKVKNADGKKVDEIQAVAMFKKGTSALNRGPIYTLIISGAMDSLFPKETSVLEKLKLYEEAYARSVGAKRPEPVPEKYIDINRLSRFQMRKAVLPAYSEPLIDILLSMEMGLKQTEDGVRYGRDRHRVVTAQELDFLDVSRPYVGPHTVAVAAHIKETRAFQYGPDKKKKAVELVLSIDGGDIKTVKWIGLKNSDGGVSQLKPGAICICVLTKFAEDRPFGIDSVLEVQPPIVSKKDEDE